MMSLYTNFAYGLVSTNGNMLTDDNALSSLKLTSGKICCIKMFNLFGKRQEKKSDFEIEDDDEEQGANEANLEINNK